MEDLVNVLSKDTGIIPYPGEPEKLYKCRLIYSAICEWMRYVTQDLQGGKTHSKSKNYIMSRCSEILEAFLEYEPMCASWFYVEDDNSVSPAVNNIRRKMINAGELIEIGDNKHLTVPSYKEYNCAFGFSRIVGFNKTGDVQSLVGITRIMKNHEGKNDLFVISHYDLFQFIEWMYEKGEWTVCNDLNQFEFFDMTSSKIPSQSWVDKPIKSMEKHIGRVTLYNGYHEYWLLRYNNGRWSCKVVEKILQEYKEERRIILGLRKVNHNNMQAEFEYNAQVIILRLFCRLPIREEVILDTYAWPLNFFNDKLNYVIPYKIWDTIKEILTKDLGIELREKR